MPESTRKLLKTLKKSLKKRGADGIAGLARKVRYEMPRLPSHPLTIHCRVN